MTPYKISEGPHPARPPLGYKRNGDFRPLWVALILYGVVSSLTLTVMVVEKLWGIISPWFWRVIGVSP